MQLGSRNWSAVGAEFGVYRIIWLIRPIAEPPEG